MSASVILEKQRKAYEEFVASKRSVILLEGELFKAYANFVAGKGSLSEEQIEKLKKVTHLPPYFISGKQDARFKKITAIDLSMFVSVVEIGHSFLFNCSALTSADLSALNSLSIIGYSFMQCCWAMTSVTLPSASKITKIGHWFLGNCSSLTTINNMEALSNVTEIGHHFLEDCSSFENVDLRPLPNVKWVGWCFLLGCPKLTKKEHLDQVDLTPLLHLSDNDIEVYEDEEDDNNLKVALARVRAVEYKVQARLKVFLVTERGNAKKNRIVDLMQSIYNVKVLVSLFVA